MKSRHLRRALVALGVVAGMVGASGGPASANGADLTGGTLDNYAASSSLFQSEALVDGIGVDCAAPSRTFEVDDGTYAWSYSDTTVRRHSVGTVNLRVTRVISSTGTSSATGLSSGVVTIGALVRKANVACAPTATTDCTITASDIGVTGTHTMPDGVAQASDTAVFNGNNEDHGDFGFEVSVTGAGTDCGSLLYLDDGSVVITDMVIHVTT